MKYLYILLLVFIPILVFGQIKKLNIINGKLLIPEALKKEECETCLKPYGLKYKINSDINLWKINKTNSECIYKLEINAVNAKYLDVVIDKFYLPENTKILFNDNKINVNNDFISLFSGKKAFVVKGSKVYIEITIPIISSEELIFDISSITYVYDDEMNLTNEVINNLSCHNDVNCPLGDDFRDIIRSVVFIKNLCNDDGQCYSCSGALVNNTLNDYKPYILTANHCISGTISDNLDETIFQFNYQNKICNVNELSFAVNVNTQDQFLVPYHFIGASLKASRNAVLGSDFALLLLNNNIPIHYNVYYAGWSRERGLSGDNVVGIHHPSAMPKKISFGNVQGVSALDYFNVRWNSGTTEGGSSGSPIFKNKKIVGQLSGGLGNTSCTNLGDDLYGHFASSWGSTFGASRRLRDWLDPLGGDPSSLEGLDPRGECKNYLNINGVLSTTKYQENTVILQANNLIDIENTTIEKNSNYLFRANERILFKGNSKIKKNSETKLVIENCNSSVFRLKDANITNQDLKIKSLYNINKDISITPNPNSGMFTLTFEPTAKTLVVRNVLGQEVFETKLSNESQKEITLLYQPTGIYTVEVSYENGEVKREKMIVE